MSSQQTKPHIVIIGSGFGGLFAAKRLAKADVDITLVAATAHHLFQPLLYQVATGILSPGDIAPVSREILHRYDNITTLLSRVVDLDLQAQTASCEHLGCKTTLHYDHLIVAAGAGPSYFGNDHFATYAPGMKSIDDALEIRSRIFSCLEAAELTDDPAERERLLTYVVVGAGPTGVEMAGQIRELTQRTVRGEYRRIDPRDARVILLDAANAVLAPFGERLAKKSQKTLERIGVQVRLGAPVVEMDNYSVTIEHEDGKKERIKAGCKVWAAGVQASPLGAIIAKQSDAEIDRAGRVNVDEHLAVPGFANVYVIGDMMARDNLPGVAQVAIQSGRYVANRIAAQVAGKPSDTPFHYRDKGSMATITKFGAVVKLGKVELTGFIAWAAWLFLHLLYIVGFKARLSTLLKWAFAFISNARAERTITYHQLVARLALRQLGQRFHPTVCGVADGDAKAIETHDEPPTA